MRQSLGDFDFSIFTPIRGIYRKSLLMLTMRLQYFRKDVKIKGEAAVKRKISSLQFQDLGEESNPPLMSCQ